MLENYNFKGVKGMRDVFPDQIVNYQKLENMARTLFATYSIGEIRTPIVEHTKMFERGVGQGTDIVNKEMFYVPAKDEAAEDSVEASRRMVMRPEATASVVRAYVEHEISKKAPGVQKYYYIGPMFRYERPQRGRLRQFTQIGVEIIGSDLPGMDGESIILLYDLVQKTGIKELEIQLNSVGCTQCRPAYIEALVNYARQKENELCPDCKIRLDKNPLRLFDCKQRNCKTVLRDAPTIQGYLCEDCKDHQDQVVALLDACTIPYVIKERLMRGLDYYTRTVFEVVSNNLGAQNAVAAGGRYDRLVEELEGPSTPAIGWSMGVERILELVEDSFAEKEKLDVFIVSPGEDRITVMKQVVQLRREGVSVGYEHEQRSVKALLKKADKTNARFSLFVSSENSDTVELKNMISGEQQQLTWEQVGDAIKAS